MPPAEPRQPKRLVGKTTHACPRDDGIWSVATPKWAERLMNPARYKGAWGGRGSGKSHWFATMCVMKHVEDQDRATVCVREVQASLKQSVKRLIEEKIREHRVEDYFDVRATEIRSTRGHGIILFQGMSDQTNESIKSLEGYDCAWVEEAQSFSQRSLDLLRPTIRKPGSEIWFTWNPQLETDPVDVFLRGKEPPPDAIVVKINHERNHWFPVVLRREMEFDKRTNFSKYQHIWQGEYRTSSEAQIFKNWREELFEAPAGTLFRLGLDFGDSQSPTVLVRCYLVGRTLYVTHEAYQVDCEIDQMPELLMTVPEAEKWPITADGARMDLIKHLRDKRGFPRMQPAVKGPGSVAAGVQWLQNYEIVVHPRCQHTIDELKSYCHPTDPLTGKIVPVLPDEDNHVIDALRYACESVRRVEQCKPTTRATPAKVANSWSGLHG